MKLVYHGITVHDSPVEVRERLALSGDEQDGLLRRFHAAGAIAEALVLHTCNRTEFYLYARKDFNTRRFVASLIERLRPGTGAVWRDGHNTLIGTDAVRHLFEVAAGLDSQMIGENQIVSQLKHAYTMSIERRMSRFFFHRLLHNAFRVAKAVRTQTDINCGAVSISLAAIALARSLLDVSAARVLLVGAGQNAAIAAKYLVKARPRRFIIASRTLDSAQELARRFDGAEAALLDQVPSLLTEADLVLCSTAAIEPVITPANAAAALDARSEPVAILDIAVPRDVDPALAAHPNVRLFNIDDLEEQIADNKARRLSEIPKARAIVEEHTQKFTAWLESLDTAEVISTLMRRYTAYARREARRYAKDFAPDDQEKLERFAESLARKILHGPIRYLKNGPDEQPSSQQLQAADLAMRMLLAEDLAAGDDA